MNAVAIPFESTVFQIPSSSSKAAIFLRIGYPSNETNEFIPKMFLYNNYTSMNYVALTLDCFTVRYENNTAPLFPCLLRDEASSVKNVFLRDL